MRPPAPLLPLLLLVALVPPARGGVPDPILQGAPVQVDPGDVTVHRVDLDDPFDPGTCSTVYDNSANYTGLFYSEQDGALTLDGLHAAEGGGLCSFTFGYNQPQSASLDATVVFYANDASDSPPVTVVAGPYQITGLPAGANAITVTVRNAPVIPRDVWMGVQFSRNSAGLLINDPPVLGTSYDYYFEIPPANYFYFGGNPAANFWLKVGVELSVPARDVSWGTLKSLHR